MPHLKFRRHYRLLLLLALMVAGLIVGAGDQRIVAYDIEDGEQVTEAVITYGHTPAAPVELGPDSIQILGTAQAAGAAGFE